MPIRCELSDTFLPEYNSIPILMDEHFSVSCEFKVNSLGSTYTLTVHHPLIISEVTASDTNTRIHIIGSYKDRGYLKDDIWPSVTRYIRVNSISFARGEHLQDNAIVSPHNNFNLLRYILANYDIICTFKKNVGRIPTRDQLKEHMRAYWEKHFKKVSFQRVATPQATIQQQQPQQEPPQQQYTVEQQQAIASGEAIHIEDNHVQENEGELDEGQLKDVV